jgi:hypothetical protein
VVAVDAIASGPLPVIGLELWVDGELANVQSAPSAQGLSPFKLLLYWEALEPGSHSLFVRAIDSMGHTANSAQLPVEVVLAGAISPEEMNNAYALPGPSVPAYVGGGGGGSPPPPPADGGEPPYQPVQPPELLPPETSNEAKPWKPTFLGWLGHLFESPASPAAPAIPSFAIEGCRPRIWISDNSTNEQGFYMYRRDDGMADFIKIATLAANTGESFTFEDGDLYGSYEYYVSAYNQNGEAPSNIVQAEIDSSDCSPETDPVVRLELTKVLSPVPLEMGYCYTSFDGMNWSRYPVDRGSFLPASDDAMGLEGLGLVTSIVDSGEVVSLDLECWGWGDGSLNKLGEWHWDNLFQDNLDLEGIDMQTYGGDSGMTFQINPDLVFQMLGYDPRVPVPYVWLGSGSQGCADHAGENLIFLLVCADIADDLDYAVWNLGECSADLCFKESDIVGYNVYDSLHNDGLTPADTVDSPISIYFMINETSCDPRHIRVSALVKYQGELLESWPSNQVFYNGNPNCPFLFGLESRKYLVTLSLIEFPHINDDPDIEDDAEGKGYVSLWTESNTGKSWTLNLLPEIDDDYPPNPYSWAGLPVCKGWGYPTFCSTTQIANLVGNNTTEIDLLFGEGVWMHIALYDHDDETADDPICVASNFYFNQAWVDSAPNQLFHGSMSASHDSGSCKFDFFIELIE